MGLFIIEIGASDYVAFEIRVDILKFVFVGVWRAERLELQRAVVGIFARVADCLGARGGSVQFQPQFTSLERRGVVKDIRAVLRLVCVRSRQNDSTFQAGLLFRHARGCAACVPGRGFRTKQPSAWVACDESREIGALKLANGLTGLPDYRGQNNFRAGV